MSPPNVSGSLRRLLRGCGLLAFATVFWAACDDDGGADVQVPSLEVRTATTGTELDQDGYAVTVGSRAPRPIGLNDTLFVDPLPAGMHTVTLVELADNCAVSGDNPVTATVTPAATAVVDFAVVCGATTGELVITTSTSGPSPDPDGYSLLLDGADQGAIESNGSRTLSGLPAGEHRVALEGVAANCTVAGDNPRDVTVTAGEAVEVGFEITCEAPAGDLEVTTTTTGADPDPDGYAVRVDADAPQPIGVNASITVARLSAGTHSVALEGLADNCVVQGDNPRPVEISAGSTTAVAFEVSCRAVAGTIAFTSNAVDLLAVFVVNPDGTGLTRLTPPESFDSDPIWSPDGQRLLFASDFDLFVMNRDGSGRQLLVDGDGIYEYRWSPDGSMIAFSADRFAGGDVFSDVWVMRADGSDRMSLARNATTPTWSPDSRQIAYVSFAGQPHIRIVNADGTGDRGLTGSSFGAFQPAWSPNGDLIAFATLFPDQEIMVIRPDGSGLVNLTRGAAADESPTWSPDGSRIAFNTNPNDDPLESEVAVMDPDGGGRVLLTNRPGFDFGPDWSPDGDKIVFVRSTLSEEDFDSEVYIMNADGSDQINITNRPESQETTPDWGGAGQGPLASGRTRAYSRWLAARRLPELRWTPPGWGR